MIVYHHPAQATPPAWLDGAADVTTCSCHDGTLFGAGPAYLLGQAGRPNAKPLDDDWTVWLNGEIEPAFLVRPCPWADLEIAADIRCRSWACPVALTEGGKPAIRANYGDDWLPDYTPEQERLLAVASAARSALEAAYTGSHRTPVDQRAACAWAAEALSVTNALTVKIIRRLSLLDDALVASVLLHLTGFRLPDEVAGGPH